MFGGTAFVIVSVAAFTLAFIGGLMLDRLLFRWDIYRLYRRLGMTRREAWAHASRGVAKAKEWRVFDA